MRQGNLQDFQGWKDSGIVPGGGDGAAEAVVPELQVGQVGPPSRLCPVHGQLPLKDILLQGQLRYVLHKGPALLTLLLFLVDVAYTQTCSHLGTMLHLQEAYGLPLLLQQCTAMHCNGCRWL